MVHVLRYRRSAGVFRLETLVARSGGGSGGRAGDNSLDVVMDHCPLARMQPGVVCYTLILQRNVSSSCFLSGLHRPLSFGMRAQR